MRLLLVEDEEDLAEGVRLGLKRAGYAVDVAWSIGAAGERLAVNAYDVLLLDVNLPTGTASRSAGRSAPARWPRSGPTSLGS